MLDILPLRAIAFQFLLLLVAISLESWVFRRMLDLDHKACIQYSITLNLFSTILGWIIFFNLQPLLSVGLKAQLLSLLFFERFLEGDWLTGVPPFLVLICLAIYLGTFLVKLQGLEGLEWLLDKKPKSKDEIPEEKRARFRGRNQQGSKFKVSSKAYSVLVANSVSFSAILLLLFLRFLGLYYNF